MGEEKLEDRRKMDGRKEKNRGRLRGFMRFDEGNVK